MLQAAKQVNGLQHAGVQWYHEEYLMGRDLKLVEPVRHTFLAELRNCSGRMAMLEGELGGLCSEYSAIKGTVDQRLKWLWGQTLACRRWSIKLQWSRLPLWRR